MDIVLFILGFILIFVGILGSFLLVLPGPPVSWLGLMLLYLTKAVTNDWWVMGITLFLTEMVTGLVDVVSAMGTKKFGGSKAGMWGTTIGLLVAIFVPLFGPLGIIIWPF